jgi:hypothetical protein
MHDKVGNWGILAQWGFPPRHTGCLGSMRFRAIPRSCHLLDIQARGLLRPTADAGSPRQHTGVIRMIRTIAAALAAFALVAFGVRAEEAAKAAEAKPAAAPAAEAKPAKTEKKADKKAEKTEKAAEKPAADKK